jgi:hypothetical protein
MHILVSVTSAGTEQNYISCYLMHKLVSVTSAGTEQMMAESNGGGSVSGGGLKPHTTVTVTTDPTLAQSLEIR